MKNIVNVLFFTALLASCQPKGYTIEGNLSDANANGKAYIEYPSFLKGPVMIDSTTITNGKFEFKGEVDKPERYHILIDLDNSNDISDSSNKKYQGELYIDNSNITFTADISTATKSQWDSLLVIPNPEISGSPTHDFYLSLNKEIASLTNELKELNQRHLELQADSTVNADALQQSLQDKENKKEQLLELLKKNVTSIVAVNETVNVLSDKSIGFSAKQIELLLGTFKKHWANTAQMVALEFTAALAYPSRSITQ